MRRARRPKKFFPQEKRFYINEQIRIPQVRLIDENGQHIGIIPTYKALQMARERELDLIEVSPKDNPPIAKIMDYGKFKYQEEKRKKKQLVQHKVEVKNIRLSLTISEHDRETRANQAEGFLNDGDRVKIEMNLKGRELQHQDLARDIVKKMFDMINQKVPVRIEQELTRQGNKWFVVIAKQ